MILRELFTLSTPALRCLRWNDFIFFFFSYRLFLFWAFLAYSFLFSTWLRRIQMREYHRNLQDHLHRKCSDLLPNSQSKGWEEVAILISPSLDPHLHVPLGPARFTTPTLEEFEFALSTSLSTPYCATCNSDSLESAE